MPAQRGTKRPHRRKKKPDARWVALSTDELETRRQAAGATRKRDAQGASNGASNAASIPASMGCMREAWGRRLYIR